MAHPTASKIEMAVAPSGITDGATSTANIDCRGVDYAIVSLNFAAEEGTDSGSHTVSLLHCDTTVVTSFATITANQTVDLASAHGLTYFVDMRAKKRYLRLSVTASTSTGSNMTYSATAVLLRDDTAPASTSGNIASTNDTAVQVT